MKDQEEVRRALDKVVPFQPKARRDKAAKALRELSTVWADDIVLELDKPGLVDGLLGTTGLTVLYGESGTGKTFVVLDLACHVAAGLPWRGLDVEQGLVVYVAAESPESVKRRLWAWKRHHGVERLPVLVVQSTVDLLNGDADTLAALLARLREEHGRLALVVVDTLARAMTGNENAPDDMGRFVAACGRLREAGETHVLVVHHSGKDAARGARGHSCLRAATDVEMEVTKGEGGGAVRVSKNRDGEEGTSYGFKLEQVELGANAKGRVVTTCVAVAAERPAGGQVTRVTSLGPNQRVTYEALTAALCDHGRDAPPAPDIPPKAKVVSVEQWREAAIRYLPQELTKHKQQAFKRAMEWLVAERVVRHADGLVWVSSTKAVITSGHTGHTGHTQPDVTDVTEPKPSVTRVTRVTHPFRGVTRVTVTDDGQGGSGTGTLGLVADEKSPLPATIIQASMSGIPVVDRVKLSHFEIYDDGALTAEWVEMNGIRGARLRREYRTRQTWSADRLVIVVKGEDIELRLPVGGTAPQFGKPGFAAMWRNIAEQVRGSGREILFDVVDRALAGDD